ncbi:MAG: NDP-hexose 2,3-dehydratase family protein [Oscillospiraceae bacterium]|nr:NDP-hexose 2,3-dehydratase family protein [Oscillospiraceae bacterium]
MLKKLILSAKAAGSEEEYNSILEWVDKRNKDLKVFITQNSLSDSDNWFYDEKTGEIRNKNNSFFQIRGLRQYKDGRTIFEQPVLIQSEIGYLGIICKEIDGVLQFLMQAKIEPGNVNKIQISPTIQATKSNFTQQHGGKKPPYLDYFLNAQKHTILFDQIQSEQSSRFLGKRNRNIMIKVDDEVEALPSHKWMTLGQIKRLMKIDNLVNMDTRTVLSCIPYSLFNLDPKEKAAITELFSDKALANSMFDTCDREDFIKVYRYINDYKMLNMASREIVPLKVLSNWNFSEREIVHKTGWPFKVIFCDIEIEGREVTHWTQPLFKAEGIAIFGLLTKVIDGKRKFLVHALAEAGCFDGMELAPSVQLEAGCSRDKYDEVSEVFFRLYEDKSRVRIDVILSEEGGRFYHEQNRNIIVEALDGELDKLPPGYFWLDFKTLNSMVQFNNVLNIQLRNLMSLIEF